MFDGDFSRGRGKKNLYKQVQCIVSFTSILLWGKLLGLVSAFFPHLLQLSYSAHQRVEEWLEVLLRTYRCKNMDSQCCCVILSKNKNQKNTLTNQWAKVNSYLGLFLWALVAAGFWMECLAEENTVCGVGVLYIKSDMVCLRPVVSWIHKETCLAPHSWGSLKLGQRILARFD